MWYVLTSFQYDIKHTDFCLCECGCICMRVYAGAQGRKTRHMKARERPYRLFHRSYSRAFLKQGLSLGPGAHGRLIWLESQLWGSTGLHLLRDDSHENLHGLQSDCWSLADSLPCQGHHSMVTIRGSKQTGLSLYVTPQDQNKASHHRL